MKEKERKSERTSNERKINTNFSYSVKHTEFQGLNA
jgi:plasmid rolling circle replication initiator protein Rep